MNFIDKEWIVLNIYCFARKYGFCSPKPVDENHWIYEDETRDLVIYVWKTEDGYWVEAAHEEDRECIFHSNDTLHQFIRGYILL